MMVRNVFGSVFKGMVFAAEAIVIFMILAFCVAFVGGCGSVSVETGAGGAGGKVSLSTGGLNLGGEAGKPVTSTGGQVAATGGVAGATSVGGASGAGGAARGTGGLAMAGMGGVVSTGGFAGSGGVQGGAGGAGGSAMGGGTGSSCLPDPWYLDLSPQKVSSEVALDFLYKTTPIATALTSYQPVQQDGNAIEVDGTFAFNRTGKVDSTGEDLGPAATGQVWMRLGNCTGTGQSLRGKTVSFSVGGGTAQQPFLYIFVKLYLARLNADGSTDIFDPGFPEIELPTGINQGVPNYKGTVTPQVADALSGGADAVNYLIIQVRERLNNAPNYSTTGDGTFKFYVENVYVGSNTAL